MEKLRKQFEVAQKYLETLTVKIQHGIFLSETDLSGTFGILDALRSEQKRITGEILKESIDKEIDEQELSLEKVEELLEIREQQRILEEQMEKIHQLVSEFLSIKALNPGYQKELVKFQSQLAEYSDEELRSLDERGDLDPYRSFIEYVKRDDLSFEEVSSLTDTFGYQLPFGLAGKCFGFEKAADSVAQKPAESAPAEEVQAQPTADPVAQENKSGPVAEENGARIADESAEIEETDNDSDEIIEKDNSGDSEAIAWRREHWKGIPLIESESLGVLRVECSGKTPKGTKALVNLLGARDSKQFVGKILSQAIGLGAFQMKDLLEGADCATDAGLEKYLRLLIKDGILKKFYMESAPETVIYSTTDAGEELLHKDAIRRYFKHLDQLITKTHKEARLDRKASDENVEINTAAGFFRVAEASKWWDKCIKGDGDLDIEITARTGVPIITITDKENGALRLLFLPALFLTDTDKENSPDLICNEIARILDRAKEPFVYVISSHSPEDCRQWIAYLQERSLIPEKARLVYRTIGEETAFEVDGTPFDLNECIRTLREEITQPSTQEHSEEVKEHTEEQADENLVEECEEHEEHEEQEVHEDHTESRAAESEEEHAEGHEGKSREDHGETQLLLPAKVNFQDLSAQENASVLLQEPKAIRENQILHMVVELASENRMAEAIALAETLAAAPNAAYLYQRFYQTFRQSVRAPGGEYSYQYSSDVIDKQQSLFIQDEPAIHKTYQTMVLVNLVWAMLFPTTAYDHNLYNNAEMVIGGELDDFLPNEIQEIHSLVSLLSTELKDISFQNDGLGFSVNVMGSLVNNGEREHRISALIDKAEELKHTPTSTVRITGLESVLKLLVGPSSDIGQLMLYVQKNERERVPEIKKILEENLNIERLTITDEWLENYVDLRWNELRKSDSKVKVKKLTKDSPAKKVCKKALSDRLQVIITWILLVEQETSSNFEDNRESYARLLNKVKSALAELDAEIKNDQKEDYCSRAGRNILLRSVEEMLAHLSGKFIASSDFNAALWMTPELMLTDSGENYILPELYGVPGLEPWVLVLRAVASKRIEPTEILEQIEDYTSWWFHNYGSQKLLCEYLGKNLPETASSVQKAEKAVDEKLKEFRSSTRLYRAYGKIQEQVMETAFGILELAQKAFCNNHNYGSLSLFMDRLEVLLLEEIETRASRYEQQIRSLEENADYAGSEMLSEIRKALKSRNFNTVDTYINCLQNGETELPSNERALDEQENFLAQFQEGEEEYYNECWKRRATTPAQWREAPFSNLGKRYQHWSSPNEKKKGCTWMENWIMGRNHHTNPARIQAFLCGMGFRVKTVIRSSKYISQGEIYEVNAEKTSKGLKDYSHPVYTFGTDLSNPMYVVCLYGCMGASTLINVMTGNLQLNGATIVLMDGSLRVSERRQVAQKFKAYTSGQSPFLLIDRVLMLYLASLDEGNRKNAMLRCTLPYTFEVLYGSGSGTVPDEMFIGRVSEINDLRNEQGPNLVYGGRQLGKTALLNRVSKTIHDPEHKVYSFCVDVKDCGSDVLLERLNRQLIKYKLIDQEADSLQHLCQLLQDLYEGNRISRLSIFVDEVDILFEEFRQQEYTALRPFIDLRDGTMHHVKFVFAGTHNVAATESVEKENNNLLHLGKPLCIEPLSVEDATKLIRIPMSYLGFEIGERQIDLILSNTNSYPGLIHMFCNALIQSVCRDYQKYYSDGGNDHENPPYRISDEQMRAVFKEKDIRKEIGTRVMSTIRLNKKYKAVSYILAQMVYEDQENDSNRLYGYSAKDLLDYNVREIQNPMLLELTEKNLTALLDELTHMGILWRNETTNEYRFRQQDFLSYIGTSEQVMRTLLGDESEV